MRVQRVMYQEVTRQQVRVQSLAFRAESADPKFHLHTQKTLIRLLHSLTDLVCTLDKGLLL